MNSCQESPRLSQRLSLIPPKLPLEMVQRTVKKKTKEMSETLCQTCLPTAATTTTTTPANARNHKRMLMSHVQMSFQKTKHRLLEGQTMVMRNETWVPALSTKFNGFIFANTRPRLMESFTEVSKS